MQQRQVAAAALLENAYCGHPGVTTASDDSRKLSCLLDVARRGAKRHRRVASALLAKRPSAYLDGFLRIRIDVRRSPCGAVGVMIAPPCSDTGHNEQ